MLGFGIKKELERTIRKMGVMDEFEAFNVCRLSQKVLKEFCKKEKEQPKVIKYIKQTQTIEVRLGSIILGQKIRAQNDLIINSINKEMGREYIKKIRYQIN
jgi:hypothetical protein